uniref:Uncharacterized protein n=1 Tax=Tanacetum cinerariifolium TaxID=118510 RepID=A0A6L2JX69_TANCI|nr:hypothetical protein [Tanacetum cinerariifolium]
MSLSKKKEKMTAEKHKGINLLSKVALAEEAQYKEVRKKSLRDFHKTHPSGSGTVTKIAPSAAKSKPSVTNEGTGVKPGVPDVTREESTKKEIGNDEEEEDDEFVKTLSNDTDDEDEIKIKYKAQGDEDENMDQTTSQLYDDVDIWLNKPVTTDEGFNQKEGADAKMTNIQQGNKNPEITLNQVIEDAHVTLSTIPQKTEVPVISSSYSSDLVSKFLNFSDIPHTNAEIVSLIDVHIHHEVPSKKTPTLFTVPVSIITESSPIYSTIIPHSIPSFTPPPPQSTPTPPPITEATNPPSTLLDFASVFQFNNRVSDLEKNVSELKKDDPLKTKVTALIDEYPDAKFISYLSTSIIEWITEQVKNQLP